jgi:branched-subunit amino acid ABC-type transport system permease component
LYSEFVALIIPSIVFGSQVAILSLGFSVAYWPSREINFAIGGVYAVCAYILWWLNVQEHQSIEVAILAALAVGVILQIAIREIIYKPLKGEALIFLASFAVFILCENTLQLIFSPNPQAMPFASWQYHEFLFGGPFRAAPLDLLDVGFALVAGVGIWFFLHRTRTGRETRAVVSDGGLAVCAGIRSRRIIAACYIIGAILVVIAATLASYQYGLNPTMGSNPVFYALNATLVGGRGNILGAGSAGMIIGIVSEMSILFFPSEWSMAVAFGFLFLVVIFRPNGIFKSQAWG